MTDYVLCCVSSKKIELDFIDELSSYLINSGANLVKNICLNKIKLNAFDIHFKWNGHSAKLDFLFFSTKYQIDIFLIQDNINRKNRKMMFFDMDSTLIQNEVIDEMAAVYGVGDQVKIITEKAMNGELNFNSALKERVLLLKGFKKDLLDNILSKLMLSHGTTTLVHELHNRGYKTAILSGGFNYFTTSFKNKLKMTYAFANELEWDGDCLTGNLVGEIINAEEKAKLIERLAAQENIPLEQVVAIGDGTNDLLMLKKAGLGIAFHAKEKVRKEIQCQINFSSMNTVLYYLGLTGDDFNEAL